MVLGQKQQTLFLNDHSFLYGKWGEYCITSPLRYNCSFLETLCLYCGIFSFCVKQIKLKQSSRSPERKNLLISWKTKSFLEILVPACWTVVLSHSLTNGQHHLNTEKLIKSRNLIRWWDDIPVVKLNLREWKGTSVLCLTCNSFSWPILGLRFRGFLESGFGWFIL